MAANSEEGISRDGGGAQRLSLRRAAGAVLVFLLLVFILPALATAGWWIAEARPASWRDADWSASGILPEPAADREPAVYLMAARTGGLKGAFSLHSWIVLKAAGSRAYERYDVVGWGTPVRRDTQPPDGRWYSNMPRIVHAVRGEEAGALVARFRQAIADYPYSRPGDYRIWPGPNSNTFTAHVLDKVPEFGAAMPSNAVGRDFAPGPVSVRWAADTFDFRVTIFGLAGFAVGERRGVEIQFAGLVAGFDLMRPALKIPAYGRVPLY